MPKAELFKELDKLTSLEFISSKHIDFYKRLSGVSEKSKAIVNKNPLFKKSLSKKSLTNRFKQGRFLVQYKDINIHKKNAQEFFKQIHCLLMNYFTDKREQIQLIQAADINPKELIFRICQKDKNYFNSLSQKLGLGSNILVFSALHLAKIFFELAALKIRDGLNTDSWQKNICPICGSEPAIAKLRRDDGKRILQCWLCETQWAFARIKCPFCNIEDTAKLRYFFVEENSPYRVYACDNCRRYIKTIDERKFEEGKNIFLEIEDIASLYLNVLIEKEGFAGVWPLSFLFSKEEGNLNN